MEKIATRLVRGLRRSAQIFMLGLSRKTFLGVMTRCKDEPALREFCDHYFAEGVDRIIVLDDASPDPSIYDGIDPRRVTVIYGRNIIKNRLHDRVYNAIRDRFEWLIYVDVDEFIAPRKTPEHTIRDELQSTFAQADCVKVPWVMMSCNRRQSPPASLRRDLVHRWDHDRKHPNPIQKFRCRSEEIEVKCILRPAAFAKLTEHIPEQPERPDLRIVDSVDATDTMLGPFYAQLTEEKIARSHLICHHYRLQSIEDCARKLTSNVLYTDQYTLDEMLASDHADIEDHTMRLRADRTKPVSPAV